MAVFNGTQKMVAVANHYSSVAYWYFGGYRWWFNRSSFCLYPFLMKVTKPTREKELETILTLAAAALVFYFLTHKQHVYWILISLMLALIGVLSKYLTAKISWGWNKLGELMGMVTGKVILSVVFFVFLFPIALLSRLFNKASDSLQLNKRNVDSYYFIRNHRYKPEDLKNVW